MNFTQNSWENNPTQMNIIKYQRDIYLSIIILKKVQTSKNSVDFNASTCRHKKFQEIEKQKKK